MFTFGFGQPRMTIDADLILRTMNFSYDLGPFELRWKEDLVEGEAYLMTPAGAEHMGRRSRWRKKLKSFRLGLH